MSSTCTSVSSAVPMSLERPPSITPQSQACAGAASPVQKPADLGMKPPSHAAHYHFANGLSFACISAAGTWLPLLSGTLSKARGIAGEKVPRVFLFQLQAAWGSVSTYSRCAETKVISSSWLPLLIPGDAQFNSGTNVQRRVVLKWNKWY